MDAKLERGYKFSIFSEYPLYIELEYLYFIDDVFIAGFSLDTGPGLAIKMAHSIARVVDKS